MIVQPPSGSRRLGGKKKAGLMSFTRDHLSPTQLMDAATMRSYKLAASGRALLDAHPEEMTKHPKKG